MGLPGGYFVFSNKGSVLWGEKKNTIDFIYLDFPLGRVSVPLTPTLFKGQV